jgi:hypothetical protein
MARKGGLLAAVRRFLRGAFPQDRRSAVRDSGFDLFPAKRMERGGPGYTPPKTKRAKPKGKTAGARHFVPIVAALRSQGYTRKVAGRAAHMAKGDTFDARLREALRIAAGGK